MRWIPSWPKGGKSWWALALLLVEVLRWLYDALLKPIVDANITNWAHQRKLDSLLLEHRNPASAFMTELGLKAYAVWSVVLGFLGSDLFLGFVIGSVVFAFWDPLTRYGRKVLGVDEGFIIDPNVWCESYRVLCGNDLLATQFYANRFYIGVSNGINNGKTLRRVQARISFLGDTWLLRLKDSEDRTTDIRHGEWALFEIGQIVSKEMMGRPSYEDAYVSRVRLAGYEDSELEGRPRGFELRADSGDFDDSLGFNPHDPDHIWKLRLAIVADDIQHVTRHIQIDLRNPRFPVSVV